MTKNTQALTVIAMAVFLFSTGCKKDAAVADTNTNEITMHSDDQSQVSDDIDATTNDVDAAIESKPFLSGRQQNIQSVCGATAVFDSSSNPRTITVTYNGINCFGTHNRTGVVVLSIPAGVHWKDAGAVITVSIQNLKITRLADNKSITLNGSETITNVSGGLLLNLSNLSSVVHTVTGNVSVTFDDNSQRSWQISKQRKFTYENGIVITTTGTHSDGTNSQIAEWGTNRFGHAFTTSITSPLIVRQDCAFRLTAGEVSHAGFANAVVTFGLDANGVPTSCPGTGSYYYKLVWTGPSGNSHTIVRAY